MLFIPPENDFAGEQQDIELDYIKEVRKTMAG
jgi:ferredoxin-thioredoxin reductase catalytic chain